MWVFKLISLDLYYCSAQTEQPHKNKPDCFTDSRQLFHSMWMPMIITTISPAYAEGEKKMLQKV